MSTTRRLNRIFRPDGRVLIVAFDHGMMDGPAKGMEQPAKTLQKIVAGGADAILTTYGMASTFAREIASLGLILRLDGGGTKLGTMGPGSQFYTIEDALRLGADAVAVSAFPGSAKEEETLRALAKIVGEAHVWGLPVMGEIVPGGFDSAPEFRTPESIAIAARVGAELGANWLKIPYVEGFAPVTAGCFAPVVILGGAKKGSERLMLENIRAALDAGAKGVAIGRNIFQAENPETMTAAVAALIHKDASIDEAMEILGRK
ncbi:MAG: deoxyribose-phosphate aldolase [Ardenticatenaceae bacterium]|nr:deoxyribose-phosphate aldolase [Ardenticatenaceae bacterium]MCB9003339.1 deoxyribose-phosphate aldolase [Ardenticatenaceae bacterium]